MLGQVIKINAGFYDILTDTKQFFRVRGAGVLRNENQTPLVGDFVEFEKAGLLQKILPRKNVLLRPKVANVDQVAVVTSLVSPAFSSLNLNRMLAMIEHQRLEVLIIFTKIDLGKQEVLSHYQAQGYQVFGVDNLTKQGLEPLREKLSNQLTVLMGLSGVGKSSLVNNIAKTNQQTQGLSRGNQRGKHTTRVVEIIDYGQGRLIDTPGFSSLKLELSKLELAHSYHDFEILSKTCKYKSCLHDHEPTSDCAIKIAWQRGEISTERYEDYLKILHELL